MSRSGWDISGQETNKRDSSAKSDYGILITDTPLPPPPLLPISPFLSVSIVTFIFFFIFFPLLSPRFLSPPLSIFIFHSFLSLSPSLSISIPLYFHVFLRLHPFASLHGSTSTSISIYMSLPPRLLLYANNITTHGLQQTPVCTKEGVIFDILNIMPYVKKHKKNPVTGDTLTPKDLVRLNISKNSDGKWHCPVTFKVGHL